MQVSLAAFLFLCPTLVYCTNLTFHEINGSVSRNQTFTYADGPYLVTSDLVISQNASVFIEAGTEFLVVPNVGVHVQGTLLAKGTRSQRITFRAMSCKETKFCKSTKLYNPGIRLVGGSSYKNGRLELERNGQWGVVCYEDYYSTWNLKNTEVACRQLGFLGAKRYYFLPASSGTVWISYVNCNGNEQSLFQCRHRAGYPCYRNYRREVAIECDTLIPYLKERVYWKGIYFALSNATREQKQRSSFLENVDIINAFDGIKALNKAPVLLNVTVRDGMTGMLAKELNHPLKVVDSKFLRCMSVGISVTSRGAPVVVQNVTVQNTRYGNGFVYEWIPTDAVHLCRVDPENFTVSFPLVLQASGDALPNNCSKTFRATAGKTLYIHFRVIAGSAFEVNVIDGSTSSKDLLSRITSDYNGKTIKTGSSSVLELHYSSRGSANNPAYLEIIIMDDYALPVSLSISGSSFGKNYNDGILIKKIIGHSKISNAMMTQNNHYGLHIMEARGRVNVISSLFRGNNKHGIYVETISGLIGLEKVNSSKNHQSGMLIDVGSILLSVSDSNFDNNDHSGFRITNQLNTTINISDAQFKGNIGHWIYGIHLVDFKEDCNVQLSNVNAVKNALSDGAFFERLSLANLIITSSKFDENGWHGLNIAGVSCHKGTFWNISTSWNAQSGVHVSGGNFNVSLVSWTSISNGLNGFYLEKQAGKVNVNGCLVSDNQRDGLAFFDGAYVRLDAALIQKCTLSNNRYGVLFMLHRRAGLMNYRVIVVDSSMANNTRGGCEFFTESCASAHRNRYLRLTFARNKVIGNQMYGLFFYGPEQFELEASIQNNTMKENTGYHALGLEYKTDCRAPPLFPVLVNVQGNIFTKNKGDYIVFVNFKSMTSKHQMIVSQNSFFENQNVHKFSTNYTRVKTKAVLAINKGNVTVTRNAFDNPMFLHEIATLYMEHEIMYSAIENWWGSSDECKVKERIFDFEDRVELARIQYYPFLVYHNSTSVIIHNSTRAVCCLQGTKLGGIVNQPITIPRNSGPYKVTDDVTVLSDGTLTIEENVTLEFDLKAVFLVYGEIIIKGTSTNRVRFIPKKPSEKTVRLVDGPGPWKGRLEVSFNNTWMPICLKRYRYEYSIVCRQLGYEEDGYLRRFPSGNETFFLHNFRCDTKENDNVANCGRENWLSLPNCSDYVAYIACKTPYWAGVHLAIAPKKSVIANLDISYAGFDYRNDLKVPGIALRIDLSHNISGVVVDNSASVGVQIMYPNPFKSSCDMHNLTISNTESDGIRLESPLVKILNTDVINTKGRGFLSDFNWKPLNIHVLNMADAKVKRYLQMCTDRHIVLDNASPVYYLSVKIDYNNGCESIITVPQKYYIGLQLIYQNLPSYIVFRVYGNKNKTSETVWDIHSLTWPSRPVWRSNTSTVVLESYSRSYHHGYSVHFMVYLIKGNNREGLTKPNMDILNSNFINNALGGIFLSNGRDILGNVNIQHSVIRNSQKSGLQTTFASVENLSLINCSLTRNTNGIKLSTFSGMVNIESTTLSNSSNNALYAPPQGQKTVYLRDSRIIYNKGYSIYVYGYRPQLSFYAINSFFEQNQDTTIYFETWTANYENVHFRNCTFLLNHGPVINIKQTSHISHWEFVENKFIENGQPSVIRTTQYIHSRDMPEIYFMRNAFLYNLCEDKGVIDVTGGTKGLIIDGNIFEGNYGRSIFLEETSYSPLTVKNNIFYNNNCSEKGVLEVRAMDREIVVDNNVFESNEGLFMVLLNSAFSIEFQMANKHVNFGNNTFVNNTNVPSNINSLACELSMSGLLDYRNFSIHYNKFNSLKFTKEVCVFIFASSYSSRLDMSLNFWGHNDANAIRKRIFDAESNYEFAWGMMSPFLSDSGNILHEKNQSGNFDKGDSVLGGRLKSTLRLDISHSPYKILSDLTVLPQISLVIDAGVEMQFHSGVGMLVLGSLLVNGNESHPVSFSLLKKDQSKMSIPVRLFGGTFPWHGKVELLHDGNWTPLCSNGSASSEMSNAKVVCKQLGYKKPLNTSRRFQGSMDVMPFSIMSSCHGNETDISQCSLTFRNSTYDNCTHAMVFTCSGGLPWGNIRFVRDEASPFDAAVSQLQHMKINHCGMKHGKDVAALEIFQYVPKVHSVQVLNCSAGGSKVWFPEKEILFANASFINTGGIGAAILTTKKNFTLQRGRIINNKLGVLFGNPNGQWMDGVLYGQVMLCASDQVVHLRDGDFFLYFRQPFVTNYNPTVKCNKLVRAGDNYGFALRLSAVKNVDYITIKDPHGNTIIHYSSRSRISLSKRWLIPRNTITIFFKGWFSTSEVLVHLERVENSAVPCTFELGNCGWINYPGSYFNGFALRRWRWYDFYGHTHTLADHTYGTTDGNFMWFGLVSWGSQHGAFKSPPVLKEYSFCYLTFYYILSDRYEYRNHISLTVFIEDNSGKTITALWHVEESVYNWKKKVLKLPTTLSSYSVVFLGYYYRDWGPPYVLIDDIKFWQCNSSSSSHTISESTISGSLDHGIAYTSTETENHVFSIFRLERSKITNNGLESFLDGNSPGAVYLSAANQVFQIFNSYFARNKNGTLYSRLQNEETVSGLPNSQFHANTIEFDRGRPLYLEGISGPFFNVEVTGNYFSMNLATDKDMIGHSICKISNVVAHVQGNFFYNNSGQYVLEYDHSTADVTGLTFSNNTLYRNVGLGVNFGVTILCNAAAKMHNNILENPRNRYQISTSLKGRPTVVNATSNWWGAGILKLVVPFIMDKTKDYRLSLTVIYEPFVRLQPQVLTSASCPPGWIKNDELCFLYSGGSFSFQEAVAYCERSGGSIISMYTDEDVRLVKQLRRKESLVRPTVVPSLWTMKRKILRKDVSQRGNEICSIVDSFGNITDSECDRPLPFVCVRRPVVHCPNGCFHHGECVGAVCFCYQGWTGEDCSKFHCHDLHNCSGNGECMGPNVCKCYPGYLGFGCTYSYCGKYESCTDCVTDPFCGWCDSSRSCVGGFADGPPKANCPDWFYYHCYTVGNKNPCSSNIFSVDCTRKQCNYEDRRATKESCQKCKDLEKCYKTTDKSQCRAWNETHCPGGQVEVDYTDSQRVNNVQLAKNVKIVEPNLTIIYACPVILEGVERISPVFVTPKVLNVGEGDILCSPQAGGIMHKIVTEYTDGPFKIMLGAPAGLDEVINYADFKKETSVESLEDQATLEDSPDKQEIQSLLSGNITINGSRIAILQGAIYKCLGHTYDDGSVSVYSYYLVIENNETIPRTGDIVVSNSSDGFIETVVAAHHNTSTDAFYLETKLQRCHENSQWNSTGLKESKRLLSKSAYCNGGDNNLGLVVTPIDAAAQRFAANDSIVGRPSNGFIAKVIKVTSSGNLSLVEVISANFNENRTISTAVEVEKLQNLHKRKRRSTEDNQLSLEFFNTGQIKHKIMSSGEATVEAGLAASLRLTAFVDIETSFWGTLKEAAIGLKLEGNLDSNLEIKINGKLSHTGRLGPKFKKQLGRTKSIRFGVIPIPVGIFLEMTAQGTAEVSGSLHHSVSVNGRIALGGECRWSRKSCHITHRTITLNPSWNKPTPKVKIGARLDITVTPTISIKMPVAPSWETKSSTTNVFKKLVGKIVDFVDLSVRIFASAPLQGGISIIYPSSQCQGRTPAQIQGLFGIPGVDFGVSVSFVKRELALTKRLRFSFVRRPSTCICPVGMEKECVGSTDSGPSPGRPPLPEWPEDPTPSPRPDPGPGGGQDSGKKNNGKNPGPECGREHVCAGKRTGPNCAQPDMWPNQDCSGNGKPVITPNCGAVCECFGGWEGQYCQRISGRGGGDPHLETLDGVNFDFFGIGEFWGCKSLRNDFGLQYRFFYYERASLIGGVALKAGHSLFTVMTIKTDRPRDSPVVRVDGILINVTDNSSQPIAINNGSVLLDRQVRFTFEEEENSVVLISLEYESGVTVTIDVKHSRAMGRQYLNVLYAPTVAYKGHTEGLCGFMDNNATNDFMGPDGEAYEGAVQFAKSWRITDCHNGSGTRYSWSWNSSNFYHEDTMDLSYTDPSFRPIYSLQGISQSVLELATSLCKSIGISDSNLQSCIYDVAITNDTTFTDQEDFKQGCPDKCSGKGRCVNGTCRCINGWAGESCNKGSCQNCSTIHGNCVKGFCVCELGWEGQSCELKATCHNVSNCTSPVHGACKKTDICQCNPGYLGVDCSIVPSCHNVSNCSGNGLCIDFGACHCYKGWTGSNCTEYSCERFDYCSERGRCVALDTCACDLGWTGASCALPDCSSVDQCSGKGECVSSNQCRCYPGFAGANCSEVADCGMFANCSGHGTCLSMTLGNVSCSCYAGFTGDNCSQPTCTSLNNCSGHGVCIEAELCKCEQGYNGTDCSNYSCEALNFCSGNGQCIGYDVCNCNSSWSGPACSIPDCSGVKNCSGQGDCILVNKCACYPAFDGKYCDQKAKPNINPPTFNQELYNATIKENAPPGTLILHVHANDTDDGRNGEIFYSLLGEKSVEDLFAVDGASGKVFNLLTFDFETVEPHIFNVTLLASDNGFPQKSSVTIVQVAVMDENDNCPIFVEPTGNLRLDVVDIKPGSVLTKVSATDLDNGVNSDISYSLSYNDAFNIDSTTGLIMTTSNPTREEYYLLVGAADKGERSCLTEIQLTVRVINSATMTPLTNQKSPPSSISSEVANTYSTSEVSSMKHTGTDTTPGSPTIREEAALVPQKGPNYVIIGASASGGLLVLVIVALLMKKCVCKNNRQAAARSSGGGRVNKSFQRDFEMSEISGRI